MCSQERFRHKFLSAFANLYLSRDPESSSEEDYDEYDYIDDFFTHPSKADQESLWEERKENARVDRITKKVKDTMADLLQVKLYKDEEDEDEVQTDNVVQT